MSTAFTHTGSNTTKARFLAPETHQRAGAKQHFPGQARDRRQARSMGRGRRVRRFLRTVVVPDETQSLPRSGVPP
jgi:hypothetical protein